MDLIQYFTLTLNSGVNSVMEGYGSVCKRVTVSFLCFFFLTIKRQKSTEKRRETDVWLSWVSVSSLLCKVQSKRRSKTREKKKQEITTRRQKWEIRRSYEFKCSQIWSKESPLLHMFRLQPEPDRPLKHPVSKPNTKHHGGYNFPHSKTANPELSDSFLITKW